MKREYVNDSEMSMSEPAVLPFISNMCKNWKEGFDKVNALYGTEIEVDFSKLISYMEEKEGENANEEQESSSETEGIVSDTETGEINSEEENKSEEAKEEGVSVEEVKDKDDIIAEEVSTNDDMDNVSDDSDIKSELEDVTEEEIVEATEALNSDTVESEVTTENDEEEGEEEDNEEEKD